VLWSQDLGLCLNTTSRPCSSQTQHSCVVVSTPWSLPEHHLETLFFSDLTQVCCGLKTFFFVSTPPRDLLLVRLNTGVLWSHYLVLCLNTTSRPCSSQTQHRCVAISRRSSLPEHHLETSLLSDSTQVCCGFKNLFFVSKTTSRPCSSQTQHRCVVVLTPCSLSQHHPETSFCSDSAQVCCGLLPCSLPEHHLETLFFSDSTQVCNTCVLVSTPCSLPEHHLETLFFSKQY